MFHKYAKFIARFRWIIIAIWLLVTVGAVTFLPNLNTVVAHQQTDFLPSTSPVIQAGQLLNQINPKHLANSTAVVAIHRASGLTNLDKQYLQSKLQQVEANESKYGVTSVEAAFNTDKSAASSFTSKDGTTEIAVIGFANGPMDTSTADAITRLHQAFASSPSGSTVYFTGDAPIQQDDVKVSMDGAKKSAGVTIALVLVILLIVFRSVIAPFVTLISIGLAFMLTSSLVAWLAGFGLPVSTFTETFLIAILFGAGTDYSIIIMNRYREEMTKDHPDKVAALTAALQAVGKTVIFSSLTVLISFATLYFANFGLYRTAAPVAVGMAVTLCACLSFIPALIHILGGGLFWPRKPQIGSAHKPSQIWAGTGGLSIRRPWWTLLVLVIVLLPISLLFTDERTFDPMADIPDAPAVQGFHVVADAFGPGRVMPTNIVLHTNENLRTPQGLATINNISTAISGVSFVDEVDSATQPVGKVISAFQISSQNQQAADGLKKIHNGLATVGQKLQSGGSNIQSGSNSANQLVNGSEQITQGAASLQAGLQTAADNTGKLAGGAGQVASGANQLQSALSSYASSVDQVHQGANALSKGLTQTSAGLTQLTNGSTNLAKSQEQLAQVASNLANEIAAWSAAHPGIQADPQWQQIEQLAAAEQSGASQVATASRDLSQGTEQLAVSMPGLIQGATQLGVATAKLGSGADQLASGAGQVANGANALKTGTSKLQNGMTQLTGGATQLVSGSRQVTTGLKSATDSFGQLSSGLQQAGSGIGRLNEGVNQVSSYLTQSGGAAKLGNPGFYVPESAISSNEDLKKAMDAYISPDGHVAEISVILKTNPYSQAAIADVPNIERAAEVAFAASPIHSGLVQVSGTTPIQSELNRVSTQDFVRTMALILITIFILLVFMLRSVIAPFYIILSLAATYFVTMGVLQVIAVHVLNKPGLSWTVPFFVFLLLVALGVDYAIFLMSRFDEEHKAGLAPNEAMHQAMGHMGNVIFSAAIIMAGTFGSMAVAEVTTLLEIGIAVIIGLLVYTLVILGFFVPSAAAVINVGHHWPFAVRSERRESRLRDLLEDATMTE